MFWETPIDSVPVGYTALVERCGLRVLPHHRGSYIATKGTARELKDGRVVLRPGFADPASMDVIEHLTFSLKHDGVNLAILVAIFEAIDASAFESALATALAAKPNGIYLRRLWFLYEWLTGRSTPAANSTAKYVPLLDPDIYVTGPERASSRHRVMNNLLGERAFCPMVRKTAALDAHTSEGLHQALTNIVSQYDPALFLRAISYLYTKETKSSYAIEHEQPSKSREERFVRLLRGVHDIEPWSEDGLALLQGQIVEPRYAEQGFRALQNYVGQSIGRTRQYVHFVPPKPEDVRDLMHGWLETATLLMGSSTDPVVIAACLSFGFVFIHPFVDGNGRLHRLLIHHILARRGVTPEGLVAPVSAVMLANRAAYDTALETFSKPLLELVDYDMSEDGSLTVNGSTASYYRYIDFSDIVPALYDWLERAIRDDLIGELDFLVGVERTRQAMRGIVDMPDRDADLFIKLCLQNGGRISATKRSSQFGLLNDEEIEQLEKSVQENMPARTISRA